MMVLKTYLHDVDDFECYLFVMRAHMEKNPRDQLAKRALAGLEAQR